MAKNNNKCESCNGLGVVGLGDCATCNGTGIPRKVRDTDPSGIDQHQPGAKMDAGKVRPSLVIEGFPRALLAISEVATFGAEKYSENGWKEVENAIARYKDAGYRHQLAKAKGEEIDSDSRLAHLKHHAWNVLAVLEMTIKESEKL